MQCKTCYSLHGEECGSEALTRERRVRRGLSGCRGGIACVLLMQVPCPDDAVKIVGTRFYLEGSRLHLSGD